MTKDTKFAPAFRSSPEEIHRDFDELSANPCTRFFDYFPLPLLILNVNRQVVFFNQAFANFIYGGPGEAALGQRPGEVFQCLYHDEEPGGCGTSEHCRKCGAVLAVQESIETNSISTHECQLLQRVGDENHALDIRIQVSPFAFGGTTHYVATMVDIEDEKRREVMERVFFHDILNTAGSAQSLVRVLRDEGGHGLGEPLELLDKALFGLVEEIQTHKVLRIAEKGTYPVSLITIQALEMVETIATEFSGHLLAEEKHIEVMADAENRAVKTDYALLRRVLVNMLKNALEATSAGGVVRVGCRPMGARVAFEVWNEAVMPESVQLQVFKRSFSTKGVGRGLGTYSIKMLTENYLKGTAEFESREGSGTVFRVVFDAA